MSGDADPGRESDTDPPEENAADSVESGASAPPDTEGLTDAGAPPEDDAPLSGLAGRIADRRRQETTDTDRDASVEELAPDRPGSPPEHDDDPFEEMSVGEIDEETLWSSLESGEATSVGDTAGVETDSLGGADPAPGAESVEGAGSEMREHVVPKKTYCQSCPYLDDPPALACTHEGTDIVEVVDSERFRVRNCPMVDE
jgi:hypothetical protein